MITIRMILDRHDYEQMLYGSACEGCGAPTGQHKPESPECARYRKEQVQAVLQRYREEAEHLLRTRPGMVD